MEQRNPYAAPKAQVDDKVDPGVVELAGRGQRLGAAIIDALIGVALAVPIWMFLGLSDYMAKGIEPPFAVTATSIVLGFVFFVAVHGYFLRQGQTVGKKILGIRITDLDDNRVSIGRLLGLRYAPISAVMFIPVVGNFLPLVDSLFVFRSDKRCIHDLIAGTKVIRN